jgi:hypothetical protein
MHDSSFFPDEYPVYPVLLIKKTFPKGGKMTQTLYAHINNKKKKDLSQIHTGETDATGPETPFCQPLSQQNLSH